MRAADYRVTSFLPLRPVELEILVALADGERHGYAIHKEVARRTGGQVEIEPGTLYRALRRLLEARLVAERRPTAHEDNRRRTYHLCARALCARAPVLPRRQARLCPMRKVAQRTIQKYMRDVR